MAEETGKKIRRKYCTPLIFDFGSPDMDVVGATKKICSSGSGGSALCCTGRSGGAPTVCAGGTSVGTICATGSGVGGSTRCGGGESATTACCAGVDPAL